MPASDSTLDLLRMYISDLLKVQRQTIEDEKYRTEAILDRTKRSSLGVILQSSRKFSYMGKRYFLTPKNLDNAVRLAGIIDNFRRIVQSMDPRHRKYRRMRELLEELDLHFAAWLACIDARASDESSAAPLFLRSDQMLKRLGLLHDEIPGYRMTPTGEVVQVPEEAGVAQQNGQREASKRSPRLRQIRQIRQIIGGG